MRTVLWSDDDPVLMRLLENWFTKLGSKNYRFIGVKGGKDALKVVRGRKKIDVLVTDLANPQMHGTDLIIEARKRRPSLPVLIASAFPESVISDLRMKGGKTTRMRVFYKPFIPEELARTIEALTQGS